MRKRKLRRSRNKIVCGVFGGIAEYFGWDKTVTRIIGTLLIVIPAGIFGGILLYFIAAILIPNAPFTRVIAGKFREK